jgi:hypothetical protein
VVHHIIQFHDRLGDSMAYQALARITSIDAQLPDADLVIP